MIYIIFIAIYILVASFNYVITIPFLEKFFPKILSESGDDNVAAGVIVWPIGLIIIFVKFISINFISILDIMKLKFENWLSNKEIKINEAKCTYRHTELK